MSASNRLNIRTRRAVRRGFTLLEIIVVVTIIALLAAMVAPRLLRNIGTSQQRIAQSEVASIAQQVNIWMADNTTNRLPDDFDLETLVQDGLIDRPEDLMDPWDRPYILINPGEVNRDFDIVSYGADGQQGGEGDDQDIVN